MMSDEWWMNEWMNEWMKWIELNWMNQPINELNFDWLNEWMIEYRASKHESPLPDKNISANNI